MKTKRRLHESTIVPTLLYDSETWNLKVTNMKKLEAARHRWLKKILGICWREKLRNEIVREKADQRLLTEIITEPRFRWFGHEVRTPTSRLPRDAISCIPEGGHRN
jgi:hypothetical protein